MNGMEYACGSRLFYGKIKKGELSLKPSIDLPIKRLVQIPATVMGEL
ncbi:hypothetical protein [Moorella sp. E306M]|nr:hypothetical protein [Moorella sp. E306M]